ncbi:DNA polymerase III subunit delta [Cytobacillus firmus]|uniref:DNA polymerase III subunit delta n=1 Tax=Cytobacillus oceanisediminis TaxID=665099 RepID=A0ABX3CKH1_9BACI|nr:MULTISPECIES: DNA polymerase III subunit delta [Bacillaceae]MBN8203896.1 DNA polymerase III subunit delta [Bacillus sp. NTK034]OHX41316.1 DNA polymerase III subunit delta [Cytobacillus oceanisediminis]
MKNVHVLFGPERYFLEKKKQEIINNTIPPEERDLSVTIHDARETSIQEALDDCQTISFLGGNRVVIVKDAYFLTTEKAREKVDHNLDSLLSYMEKPSGDAVLVIMVPYEKLDNRKKVVKNLKKLAAVYEAKSLKGGQLFDWVYKRTREQGVSMSTEGINLLISYIGSNLYQLENEIIKMALHIGPSNELEVQHIENLVSRTLEQDIFKLINAIVSKRAEEAFLLLEDMFRQGEDSIKIINLIARQFRILFQLQELKKEGLSNGQIASKIKLPPFLVNMNMNLSGQYEGKELLGILSQLTELDYQMKTGQVSKELALESFIAKIA